MNQSHLPPEAVVARPEEFRPDVLKYVAAAGRTARGRWRASYAVERVGPFAGPRRG